MAEAENSTGAGVLTAKCPWNFDRRFSMELELPGVEMDILMLKAKPIVAGEAHDRSVHLGRPIHKGVGTSQGNAPPGQSTTVGNSETEATRTRQKTPGNMLDLFNRIAAQSGDSGLKASLGRPEVQSGLEQISFPPTAEQLVNALGQLGITVPGSTADQADATVTPGNFLASLGNTKGLTSAAKQTIGQLMAEAFVQPMPASGLIDMTRPPVPSPNPGPSGYGSATSTVPPISLGRPVAQSEQNTGNAMVTVTGQGTVDPSGMSLDNEVVAGLNLTEINLGRPNMVEGNSKGSPDRLGIPTVVPGFVPHLPPGNNPDDATAGNSGVAGQGKDQTGIDPVPVQNSGNSFSATIGGVGKSHGDDVPKPAQGSGLHPTSGNHPTSTDGTSLEESNDQAIGGGLKSTSNGKGVRPGVGPKPWESGGATTGTEDSVESGVTVGASLGLQPTSKGGKPGSGKDAIGPPADDVVESTATNKPLSPTSKGTGSSATSNQDIEVNPSPVKLGRPESANVVSPSVSNVLDVVKSLGNDTDETDDTVKTGNDVVNLGRPDAANSLKPTSSKGVLPKDTVESVAKQVADRIESMVMGKKSGTVTIKLDPIDLGSVTLTVKSFGSRIDADIKASDNEVRSALHQHRHELVNSIQNRGLTMSSFNVGQDGNTDAKSHQGQRSDFAEAQRNSNLKLGSGTSQVTVSNAPSNYRSNSGGMDYTV